VNIVIPMAGKGQRFSEAGFAEPKPLIDANGVPMYARAVESLPISLASRLIFICLREHLESHRLEADIQDRYAEFDPIVLPLDGVTEGQACTVLKARQFIDSAEPLLIYNADTVCRTDLDQTLPLLAPEVEGLIGVFQAEGDRWSFARVEGESDRVVETAEKVRISDWATTGLYYFRRGADFVRHADGMVSEDDRTRGEFYVIPVYNRMIAEGADVRIDRAHDVSCLGTPEELSEFNRQNSAKH